MRLYMALTWPREILSSFVWRWVCSGQRTSEGTSQRWWRRTSFSTMRYGGMDLEECVWRHTCRMSSFLDSFWSLLAATRSSMRSLGFQPMCTCLVCVRICVCKYVDPTTSYVPKHLQWRHVTVAIYNASPTICCLSAGSTKMLLRVKLSV